MEKALEKAREIRRKINAPDTRTQINDELNYFQEYVGQQNMQLEHIKMRLTLYEQIYEQIKEDKDLNNKAEILLDDIEGMKAGMASIVAEIDRVSQKIELFTLLQEKLISQDLENVDSVKSIELLTRLLTTQSTEGEE